MGFKLIDLLPRASKVAVPGDDKKKGHQIDFKPLSRTIYYRTFTSLHRHRASENPRTRLVSTLWGTERAGILWIANSDEKKNAGLCRPTANCASRR